MNLPDKVVDEKLDAIHTAAVALAAEVDALRRLRAWPHSMIDGPDGDGYPSFAEPFGEAS